MRKIALLTTILLISVFNIPSQAHHQPGIQPQSTSLSNDSTEAIEVIGHLGGSFGIPVFEADNAYLTIGHSFGVLDISDPTNISQPGNTGYLPISSPSSNYIEISLGNNTISLFESHTLYLVDIQNPAEPSRVGNYEFSESIRSAVASGQYIYVSLNNQLHIMDVSNPAIPVQVGTFASPSSFSLMLINGNQIIALGAGNIYVLSIADPLAPQLLGSLDTLDDAIDMAISGNRVYVITSDAEIAIVEVDGGGIPSLLGTYTFAFSGWEFITDVAANGKLVFVTAYSAGLRVLDTTNPASATEVGSIGTGWFAMGVASQDNTVYVIDSANTMSVYEVSLSGTPTFAGTYNPMGYTYALDVLGEYAYLYDNGDGMRVINVSDPTQPQEIALYPFGGYSEGIPADVKAENRYVYVADYGSLGKVDILDPANPVNAGESNDSGEHLALYGAYGYATDRDNALKIFDLSGTPNQIGSYTSNGIILDVTISGTLAYLLEEPDCDSGPCNGTYKVQVLDLATPTNPQPLGFYSFPYPVDSSIYIEDFAVAGDYVYVVESCHWEDLGSENWACQDGGLHILDVSDPNQLAFSSNTDLGYHPIEAINVKGTFAYITTYNDLQLWDVINPENPAMFATLSNIGGTHIVFKNNLIYLNDDGLTILQPNFLTQSIIPPEGGNVATQYDNTQYQFSEITFSQPVTFTHSARSDMDFPLPASTIGIGHAFENEAVDSIGNVINPSDSYTVTITYSQDEVGAAIENTLSLYSWDGNQWQLELTSSVDPLTNTILAAPDHFGFWAVFGETKRLYLPIINRQVNQESNNS